jgi:hypothetical protein
MRGPQGPSRALTAFRRTPSPSRRPFAGLEGHVADILFLALGLGAFALFGLYAALLRKV